MKSAILQFYFFCLPCQQIFFIISEYGIEFVEQRQKNIETKRNSSCLLFLLVNLKVARDEDEADEAKWEKENVKNRIKSERRAILLGGRQLHSENDFQVRSSPSRHEIMQNSIQLIILAEHACDQSSIEGVEFNNVA